jgi:hypothetical protein
VVSLESFQGRNVIDNLVIPRHLLEKWADQAVTEGHARHRLSKRVYEYMLAHCKHHQRFEIDGVTYTPKQYVDLIAHTALREAQTKATLESCRQYENDLVIISSHGTICEECIPFEGNIYSISGTSQTYPMLEKMPPFHPNCQHSMLATSTEVIEVVTAERGTFETILERRYKEAREAAQDSGSQERKTKDRFK